MVLDLSMSPRPIFATNSSRCCPSIDVTHAVNLRLKHIKVVIVIDAFWLLAVEMPSDLLRIKIGRFERQHTVVVAKSYPKSSR